MFPTTPYSTLMERNSQLDPLPEAENAIPKEEFKNRYQKILGKKYSDFIKYSLSYITKSIRINTLKTTTANVKKSLELQNFSLKQIPWCKTGFWTSGDRTDLGNLTEHFLGYFYVQEAASMIPPVVLNPKPKDLVLDMCSSPGSKTTQMAAMMKNKGLIIANDVTGTRMKPLGLNLQRSGITNTAVTIMHGQRFASKGEEFDKVLVDAPCSGTGTIRRSPETLKKWNPNMIRRLSKTQKSLAETGFKILKSNGTMAYSTCSVEPEENEEVVDALLKKFPEAVLEEIQLPIKRSPPISEFKDKKYHTETSKCLRIWPQDNNTEGFFVAKIRKS